MAPHESRSGLKTDTIETPRHARHAYRQERPISRMLWRDQIEIHPDVRAGKPCVKGTRITVYDVLEYLAGGMSEQQILNDFPDLSTESIRACLTFAAVRERRLSSTAA